MRAIPLEVVELRTGKAVRMTGNVPAGSTLATFSAASRLGAPQRHTLQIGPNEHVTLNPEVVRYINHACAPNARFDVERWALIALRELRRGEEVTVFYPATEWEMANGFDCTCGAMDCLGRIEGASRLPPEILSRYTLASWIAARLE